MPFWCPICPICSKIRHSEERCYDRMKEVRKSLRGLMEDFPRPRMLVMSKSMPKYIQIIRYIFAGGFATASNLVILFIGVKYFKLWYLTSAIIAFCCAVIISYLLQKFWTFKNYSTQNMYKQFLSFFLFALIMLGVNTLLMYVFVALIGFQYLLAQAFISLIIACINYVYFNKIIFNNA